MREKMAPLSGWQACGVAKDCLEVEWLILSLQGSYAACTEIVVTLTVEKAMLNSFRHMAQCAVSVLLDAALCE